ncbi:hypothetical protein MTR_1g075120 [Medicago truncatula]|uniref:Uncharacterized protein n=1 Tax=Medicago truncatula TaxID=3880 RepID=G7I3X3_MEDTR|nr:hypothetical protein MTR_1g075120 [Medicago truncatula]
MRVQVASKDFTKGGILFPSSKTSYIVENTSTCEENRTGAVQEEGDSRRQGGVLSSPIFYRATVLR